MPRKPSLGQRSLEFDPPPEALPEAHIIDEPKLIAPETAQAFIQELPTMKPFGVVRRLMDIGVLRSPADIGWKNEEMNIFVLVERHEDEFTFLLQQLAQNQHCVLTRTQQEDARRLLTQWKHLSLLEKTEGLDALEIWKLPYLETLTHTRILTRKYLRARNTLLLDTVGARTHYRKIMKLIVCGMAHTFQGAVVIDHHADYAPSSSMNAAGPDVCGEQSTNQRERQ